MSDVNVKEAVKALLPEAIASQWQNTIPDTQGSLPMQIETLNEHLRYRICASETNQSNELRSKMVSANDIPAGEDGLNVWLTNFKQHLLDPIVAGVITLND
jgi:hypothetical protein